MKKNNKFIIAILIAVILACALVACSNTDKKVGEMVTVTEVVTDDAGEAVTDEAGEVVTEEMDAEVKTDANGEAVTEVVTDSKGTAYTHADGSHVVRKVVVKTTSPFRRTTTTKKTTTAKNSKSTTKANSKTTTKPNEKTTNAPDKQNTTPTPSEPAVQQAPVPDNVTNLNVSDIKTDSFKVSWSGVTPAKDCTIGYTVRYSADGGKTWTKVGDTNRLNMVVKGLESYTDYIVGVIAYNKNAAGPTCSAKWTEKEVQTAVNNEKRTITVKCKLPVDGTADKLTIEVREKGEGKKFEKDGSKETPANGGGLDYFVYKTEKEYKGLVKIRAIIGSDHVDSEYTDKDTVVLDLTNTNITIIEGDDD